MLELLFMIPMLVVRMIFRRRQMRTSDREPDYPIRFSYSRIYKGVYFFFLLAFLLVLLVTVNAGSVFWSLFLIVLIVAWIVDIRIVFRYHLLLTARTLTLTTHKRSREFKRASIESIECGGILGNHTILLKSGEKLTISALLSPSPNLLLAWREKNRKPTSPLP